MTKRLHRNQQEKVKTGFWLLNRNKISEVLFYLLILFLPTEFGKHFWPNFSFIFGLRLDYLSPTLYFTDVLIIALLIFSARQIINYLQKVSKKNLFGFTVLLLSLLIGIVGAKNPEGGLYGSAKLLEFSFLTLFIIINFKSFNKQILFICFLSGILFESTLAFLQIINQGSLNGIFYFLGERMFTAQTPGIANASINGQLFLRPYATFPHPNVLAGYLIISTLFLYMLSINKIFLTVATIVGTTALLLTLSRAAIFLWLTYLIIFFAISLLEKYKKSSLNPKFILGIVITAVLAIFFFSSVQNNFIWQRFIETRFNDESIAQRGELINQANMMFYKNPVFGVGLNNFFNNLNFNHPSVLLIQPVHNIFLLVLAEAGLVGLVFSFLVLYRSLKPIIFSKLNKQRKYLLAIWLAIFFLGFFDHYFLTLQQGQLMLSLVIGVSIAYKTT